MDKTFVYLNHQNKGKTFQQALLSNGWKQVGEDATADVCLADSDVTPFRILKLENIAKRGTKIMIYPHAARPNIFYDFPGMQPFPQTTAQFVVTQTHKEVMERIGYPFPLYPVGWSYCPLKAFHPLTRPIKRILFAPIHANGNGWLHEEDKELNRRTMDLLLNTCRNNHLELTVRYLRTLESCGLKKNSYASYTQGNPDQSFENIDHSDIVVSHQTYAWIAVARGKPTLMMGEDVSPRVGNCEENFRHVAHWDDYKDLIMYPYDILKADDIYCMMEQVAFHDNENVREWRKRMIGQPFCNAGFIDAIENLL